MNESDHTVDDDDDNGYMFLVNVKDADALIFKYTLNNLFVGQYYEFSAYIANVIKSKSNLNTPNIRFEVRSSSEYGILIASNDTGNIVESENMTWLKYNLLFEVANSSIVLLMFSNVAGGLGNIVAIDDIEFRLCSNTHTHVRPPGLFPYISFNMILLF